MPGWSRMRNMFKNFEGMTPTSPLKVYIICLELPSTYKDHKTRDVFDSETKPFTHWHELKYTNC